MPIFLAESSADIARCFDVMKQLRTHLSAEEFIRSVVMQREQGYQLAISEREGTIVAVAGFRVIAMLFSGKTLYVDDLVTDAQHRSQGIGKELVHWLIEYARKQHCQTFSLDSGVQRDRAHAFYFGVGMHISSYHFQLPIPRA